MYISNSEYFELVKGIGTYNGLVKKFFGLPSASKFPGQFIFLSMSNVFFKSKYQYIF